MQNIIPDISPVIATLLGGVLALAGVWITQKATRSNRVWELRKENYTIILKRLKEASEHAAIVDDGYNSREYGLAPTTTSTPLIEPNRRKLRTTLGKAAVKHSMRIVLSCPTSSLLVSNSC